MAAADPAKRRDRAQYMREWLKTEAGQRYRTSEARADTLRRASARYDRTHRDQVRAKNRRRRAREAGASGDATAEQIRARMEYWGTACWMCGGAFEEVDHVKPLTLGGTNWPANLRPSCKSCNARKYNRYPYVPAIAS